MRTFATLLGLVLSMAVNAQELPENEYQAGEHYEKLDNPVPTSDPEKIEVVEVFSYLCGHCFSFAPLLQEWEQQLPEDVTMVHTPAIWNRHMETYARGFYTAKALGIWEQVHMPIFTSVHQERQRLTSEEDWAEFLAEYGADETEAQETFNSFGVTQQVRQADQRVRSYGISGTPELVVDGEYRVSARMAGSHQEMLKVVDYLLEKIRAEQ